MHAGCGSVPFRLLHSPLEPSKRIRLASIFAWRWSTTQQPGTLQSVWDRNSSARSETVVERIRIRASLAWLWCVQVNSSQHNMGRLKQTLIVFLKLYKHQISNKSVWICNVKSISDAATTHNKGHFLTPHMYWRSKGNVLSLNLACEQQPPGRLFIVSAACRGVRDSHAFSTGCGRFALWDCGMWRICDF